MVKSVNQLISETVRYAQMAGKDIAETDVRDRYEEYRQRHGQEKADIALKKPWPVLRKAPNRKKIACSLSCVPSV